MTACNLCCRTKLERLFK